jgi:hypothetical protein
MLAAGKSEDEEFQKLEITESTWQRWNSQYGGMNSDEAKRLRELEIENQRLKERQASGSRTNKTNQFCTFYPSVFHSFRWYNLRLKKTESLALHVV